MSVEAAFFATRDASSILAASFTYMAKKLDLVGQAFGRLTVIEKLGRRYNKRLWKCTCTCGQEAEVCTQNLTRRQTVSCGCYAKEISTRHGLSNTRLNACYQDMLSRVENENCPGYRNYGGRDISICKEWREDRSAFFKWALSNGYNDSLTLDREDNNGNYEPSNCRWVDYVTQNNNLRSNRLLTFNGKTQTVPQWARELGLKASTLRTRLSRDWPVERVLEK